MSTAIKFENISKQYRLGLVSTKTLSHDLNRWFQTNLRGKEDPYLTIGDVNDRSKKAESDYVWALRNINFEVQQGDVLGIIGKNGAGKSTLLKILSKVTAPTTGAIKAAGRIASLLEVGTGFHPEMTGRENIYMNGAIMGMTKQEITRKLDEIIDFSGVERYIDTPAKRYSSGMTVRLGFAIAAHLDPEILVVDEVLAVGDAEFQKKAIGKMKDVAKGEGRTVLFVSHNLAAVRNLCKTGVVLENGQSIFSGSAEEAINHYMLNTISSDDKKLLDCLEYNTSKLVIDEILVNESTQNLVKIGNNNNEITISLKGQAHEDMKIALEVKLYDQNEVPLAFFSPNQESGITKLFKKGKFEIVETLKFPDRMSKGTYYADIYITNPFVEGYVDIIKGLVIESEGHSTKTGFVFDYSKSHGWLFLH